MLGIWFAIIFFIFGMLFINFIGPDITTARNGLSCTDPSISDGTKLTCLAIDGVMPYFIILVISIAGGIILEKALAI